MARAEIAGISPFFIVNHVLTALAFYRDRLGFEITFQGPEPDDIFFGIVRRGGAQILLKDIGVAPVPNYTRDIKKGIARWDAYVGDTRRRHEVSCQRILGASFEAATTRVGGDSSASAAE